MSKKIDAKILEKMGTKILKEANRIRKTGGSKYESNRMRKLSEVKIKGEYDLK